MKERGQSLVELAISFVFLMILLAAAVEFGMVFFQFVQLRDAVQEGAVYGSMNPTDLTTMEARARGTSNSPLALNDPAVTFEVTYSNLPCEGSYTITDENDVDTVYQYTLTVKMNYQHVVFMPFLSTLIKTIPLRAESTSSILSPVCQ